MRYGWKFVSRLLEICHKLMSKHIQMELPSTFTYLLFIRLSGNVRSSRSGNVPRPECNCNLIWF